MFTQINYVMVMVSNMTRSVEFYRDKLGLTVKFASPEWTEFQTGSTTLALHGGGRPQQQSQEVDAGVRYAGTCSIGFSVDKLDEVYNDLQSRGVKFIMAPTLREQEGITLAVCTDPDGLPISFAETVCKTGAQAGS